MNTKTTMRTEIADSRQEFERLIQEAHKHLTPVGGSSPEFWYRGHDRGIYYTLTPSLFRYQQPEEKELELFDIYARHGDISKHGSSSWARVIWMQHYGIPTRLLDWTTKREVAVFFAVKFLVGKPRQRVPPDDRPCIYILNPARLNEKNDIFRVPRVPKVTEPEFEDLFSEATCKPMKYPLAVAPVDSALNPRLRCQRGCFTVHGLERAPLEYQAPDCVFRISLTEQLCDEFCNKPDGPGCDALELFPDFEGIAQFVASKAGLSLVPYDQELARRICIRLKERNKQYTTQASVNTDNKDYNSLFGSCNFEKAYIPRPDEADKLVDRLKKGPPFIFITGEAGIGKTNFILQNLLHDENLKQTPSFFFPLRLYDVILPEGFAPGISGHGLMPHLYEIMIGKDRTAEEQEVARQMIREGAVVLALDGLDELARNKGQEVVSAIIFELESLVATSTKARVVISCRKHIFDRLHETGSLGRSNNAEPIEIKPFGLVTMQDAMRREFGRDLPQLAVIAETPLLYQMIRSAKNHLPELLAACENSTRLQEAWFKVMLEDGGDSLDTLDQLGVIAVEMLKRRSDILEVVTLKDGLPALIYKLSKPPFVLFIEEKKRGSFAFSHQSLRVFVLAWCIAKEIKTRSFDLLKATSSFDYEGHEFYDRVRDLLKIKLDVIEQLDLLLDVQGLDERERNHLIRNLFEMLGELTLNQNDLVKRIVKVALPYLKPAGTKDGYITYKTRYNIVRCLERIHWSASRPYIEHIKNFRFWSDPSCKPPPGEQHLGAYSIRGFHRPTQEATSTPPILYKISGTPLGMDQLETEVSSHLMAAIEGLTEHEIPEDACFLGINSTLALIRWLPKEPDLARIEGLLRHQHVAWQMKQNLFYALFIRYGEQIPDRFQKTGLFRDAGELKNPSDEAKRTFQRLIS